ncbi:autotransporter outer membrane beta-barrel domain-containing protein [Citrobacter sedlakii]|uniref:autotransporter outer membrane beta-barrel domain-containing protein n=4 Tax=Citrobacter sedlakii TaxID=67826 RepID=UPI003314F796
MKQFKLTTTALLISSLLMTNYVHAELYNENGVMTGSGELADGGTYSIVSTSGEHNTISVANNGSVTINNPGGTALVSGHGELETGDFMLASGTVLLYNSGTINLGSGSTVNQIVGDYIPGTRPNRPDLPLDADYDFMSAVTIMTEENISAPLNAQQAQIVADDLTVNMSHKRDDKGIAGIYGAKNNGSILLSGNTTVNTTVTGANSNAFGVYAKYGTRIEAENVILNSKGTGYAGGIISEAMEESARSLIRYQNATVTSVADQFADGISANGGKVEALGDTVLDVTVNAVGGVASGIWLSDGFPGVDVDAAVTTVGTTTMRLNAGADQTVLDGVDSMGSTVYTGNDLSITFDAKGHQQTTGTGLYASMDQALAAGKIAVNGSLDIDVVDATRSGSWNYLHADKGGEITLNGEVRMGVNYNDPDAVAILAENADSRVTINPQKVYIVGTLEAKDAATIDITAINQSRFDGGAATTDDAVSNLSLAEQSVWNMTKDSQLTNLSLNDSTLTFMPSSATTRSLTRDAATFKTLTVNGDYTGVNGNLVMNTQLGDDTSATDKLVVQGNTSGNTNVTVLNAGGAGGLTTDGIELISVAGNSDGVFTQNGRIVAGAYDYTLQRGEGQNEKNWYLTSALTPEPQPEPVDPTEPVDPVDPLTPQAPTQPEPQTPREHAVRPEAGLYGMNLQAANTMFNTRLHDRLGETHYVDALTGEKAVTSLWLRNVGGHTRQQDGSGQLDMQANRYVMQLGGDIAQWSSDNTDRFHLGLMAGYANQKARAENQRNGNRADSRISGYSVGLYGTWLQDNATHEGAYVDTWAQYSWFDNTVSGRGVESEEYDSKGFTASVESGYTWKLADISERNALYIQPKAQVTWMGVKADEHREANGTRVEGHGDGNVQTRVGVRLFGKGHNKLDDGKDRTFQPFVEANWIHNSKEFGVSMNGDNVDLDGTRNIGELKAGVEGQLTKNVSLWGNVGQQIGDKGYSDTSAMIGIKASF